MRLSKVICALFAATFVFGGFAVAEDSPLQNKMDLTFPITPIEERLTGQQVMILDFYMNHLNAPEMENLPRALKAQLPLYIAAHSDQLDPGAIVRFKRSQLLNAGMTFNDILTLQSTLNTLQSGAPLTKEQNAFLSDFITNQIRKNETIALDSFIQPLYAYVRDNPNLFSKKTMTYLNDALLISVGMKSGEISKVNSLAVSKEPNPSLSNSDVVALRKFILAGQLQGVDFMQPPAVLNLQKIVMENGSRFSDRDLYLLDAVVRRSPSIQKYSYDNFKASEINNQQKRASSQGQVFQAPMWQRPMQSSNPQPQRMMPQQQGRP